MSAKRANKRTPTPRQAPSVAPRATAQAPAASRVQPLAPARGEGRARSVKPLAANPSFPGRAAEAKPELPREAKKAGRGLFGRRKQRSKQDAAAQVTQVPQAQVAPDAAPAADAAPAKRRRWPFVVLSIVVAIGAAASIGYAVLSNTAAFAISSIVCEATEHVSAEAIATLAAVPEGTTLLNYDAAVIEANLKRNPWVGSVEVSREYPDRLRISVKERAVTALVPLNAGSVVWCLGSGDVWIEPIKVVPADGQTLVEAALQAARDMDALLITDLPSSVNPVAGEPASDEVFSAISAYRFGLSATLWKQVVSFSAPSVEGLACTLESGVEISLGAPTAISSKEGVIEQLLAKYPNRITYINVRVVSNPSYRMLDSDTVQEGTGVLGGGYGPNADEPLAAGGDEGAQEQGQEQADDAEATEGSEQDAGESAEGDVLEGQVVEQEGAGADETADGAVFAEGGEGPYGDAEAATEGF